MLPLRDSQPTDKKPWVTWLLILGNVVVFLLELGVPDMELFVQKWGLVAAEVNLANLATLTGFLTSQFLHGGLFHLLSNMWFLRIFGDNVEEEIGHLKFLFFYLIAGIVAGLAQYIFMANSEVPMIGASGAIAGVLGAYFVFFPHHRVETLIPVWGFYRIIELPASIVLFYWFIIQVFSGLGSLVNTTAEMGGVAFLAHAGGFGFGWVVGKIVDKF